MAFPMQLLAIDTALNACSAAVLDDSAGTVRLVAASEAMDRGHAERLMTMIGEVLADASLSFSDLDRIVVTTGPGSFTGVRVGLAAARGLGLVLKKPVIGLTTLAAFAEAARAQTDLPIAVALDAKRGEIYGQVFAGRAPVTEPMATTLEAFLARLPDRVAAIGSAAEMLAEAMSADGMVDLVLPVATPPIEAVARLGASLADDGTVPKPLYLRAPDAKPQTGKQIERA